MMTIVRTVGVAVLAIATFGLAGCGGGAEGTYKLDKAGVKKAMEADMAKMDAPLPAGLANIATAMIDAMEMTIELQPGGRAKMTSMMPSFEAGKPGTSEDKEGTWKADGASVVITSDGKPHQCSRSRAKLTCESDRKGDPALIFVKS
jgi:hypothetical protein